MNIYGKSTLSRRNGKCKGPEAGEWVVCWRISEEICEAGGEKLGGRQKMRSRKEGRKWEGEDQVRTLASTLSEQKRDMTKLRL